MVLIILTSGYRTYNEAVNAVLKKSETGIRKLSDYRFYDADNEIEYELKLVTIF